MAFRLELRFATKEQLQAHLHSYEDHGGAIVPDRLCPGVKVPGEPGGVELEFVVGSERAVASGQAVRRERMGVVVELSSKELEAAWRLTPGPGGAGDGRGGPGGRATTLGRLLGAGFGRSAAVTERVRHRPMPSIDSQELPKAAITPVGEVALEASLPPPPRGASAATVAEPRWAPPAEPAEAAPADSGATVVVTRSGALPLLPLTLEDLVTPPDPAALSAMTTIEILPPPSAATVLATGLALPSPSSSTVVTPPPAAALPERAHDPPPDRALLTTSGARDQSSAAPLAPGAAAPPPDEAPADRAADPPPDGMTDSLPEGLTQAELIRLVYEGPAGYQPLLLKQIIRQAPPLLALRLLDRLDAAAKDDLLREESLSPLLRTALRRRLERAP